MITIGKVDLESNRVVDYIDPDSLDLICDEDFLVDGPFKLFNKSINCSLWVSQSLIDNEGNCYLRILPKDLSNGRYFTLIPKKNLVEGIIYLINNNLCYKYKLKFQ